MAGNVFLPGAVSAELLIFLLRELRRSCAPSVKEGFGIVFLEAMYYRKPCIGRPRSRCSRSHSRMATVACLWRAPSFLLGFTKPSCACSETRRGAEPWELTEEQSSRATFRSPAFATGWNRFSAALANALL